MTPRRLPGSFLGDSYTGPSSMLHLLLQALKRVQQCNDINNLSNKNGCHLGVWLT